MTNINLEKLSAVIKKHGEAFLAWALCALSISAVLYIYTDNPVNVYTVIGAAAAAGLIKLFDFLRTKKLGGVVYFAMLITISITSSGIVGRNWDAMFSFVRWFFSGAQAEETRAAFMLALTLFMVYFITSSFYYFTKVIYRSSMLALVSLIPFALAVKASASLPLAYAVGMASVNLIFLIIDGRKLLLKGSAARGRSWAVYTDFAAAALLLALILPKPSETPYYDKFEAAVSMFSFGGSGETVYRGEYKKESGGAEQLLKGESKLIYVVSTADPVYMKTQVFDLYNTETGKWTALDEISGNSRWEETAYLLNYEKLAAALTRLYDSSAEFAENHPEAADIPEAAETESYSIVYARDYTAQYIIAPLRTVKADISGVNGAKYTARSEEGELFSNLYMPPNANYTVRYYSEGLFDSWLESGFCDISLEDYGRLLSDAYAAQDYLSENSRVINEFYTEYIAAKKYKRDTKSDVSPEIQSLSDELTAGLEYDYQKARAIEQYLNGGGFVYDLSYEPPEGMDTPEYFLFESKRGICTDFATAFTLLARAAGLTVRYTEGFVPRPSEETQGIYYINTDNAHAYPEVYIPGAGWVIYEPTAAGAAGGGGLSDIEDGGVDYLAVFLAAVAVVCGLGMFMLIVLFMPIIAEGIFRIKAKHTGGGKAVIMLYNRFVKAAESRFGVSMKAFTPEQTEAFTEEKTGISAKPLTEPFTAACYGGEEVSFEKAYGCYKALRKNIKAKKRKKGRKER